MAAQLIEPLRAPRLLDNSTGYRELKSFRCGRKGRSWEVAVNDWAVRVYQGALGEPQTVVLLEDAIHQPVGLASVKPRELRLASGEVVPGLPYIHMFGVHFRYHRKRVGSRLLRALLAEIVGRWPREFAFPVWAYVHPDNAESHALFGKHGFELQGPVGEGHDAIRILHRPDSSRA